MWCYMREFTSKYNIVFILFATFTLTFKSIEFLIFYNFCIVLFFSLCVVKLITILHVKYYSDPFTFFRTGLYKLSAYYMYVR